MSEINHDLERLLGFMFRARRDCSCELQEFPCACFGDARACLKAIDDAKYVVRKRSPVATWLGPKSQEQK